MCGKTYRRPSNVNLSGGSSIDSGKGRLEKKL